MWGLNNALGCIRSEVMGREKSDETEANDSEKHVPDRKQGLAKNLLRSKNLPAPTDTGLGLWPWLEFTRKEHYNGSHTHMDVRGGWGERGKSS